MDLAPMVDIVFLLVIFFLTTSTFVKNPTGLPVDLPSAQRPPVAASGLTVDVASDGRIAFDGREGITPAALEKALRAQLGGKAQAVTLRADRTARHGRVVEVMDAIKRSGAARLTVAARDK
jgi:biopolymer transport protein ExbD